MDEKTERANSTQKNTTYTKLKMLNKAQIQRFTGFTLIELLVVVAIIGIVTSVALPSIRDMTARNRLKGIVNTMAQEVQLARSEAVLKSSNTMTLSVNKNANWCFGIDKDAACNCNITDVNNASYCDIKRVRSADFSGITVDSVNTSLATTTFTSTGIITAGTGKIRFQSGSYTAALNINIVGRVLTCSDNVPGFASLTSCD